MSQNFRCILNEIAYNARTEIQPRSKFRDSQKHRPGRLPGPYQIGARARFERVSFRVIVFWMPANGSVVSVTESDCAIG